MPALQVRIRFEVELIVRNWRLLKLSTEFQVADETAGREPVERSALPGSFAKYPNK